MVLLSVLHALAQKHGWQLTIAHLNHQLRGRSSDADERLVRRTAERLGLPVVIERAQVREFARAHNLSIEMAARGMRHEFLARSAATRGISRIALGHHADDQVELFFLRLLRGSGSEGLAGMSWSNRSPANRKLTLVRPLLELSRHELRNYAVGKRIPFRDDASNASFDFQRNRLRHELLPLLRKHYQPGLHKLILRLMNILAGEAEFINGSVRAWQETAKSSPQRSTPFGRFDQLPLALQRRVLRLQLLDLGISPDFALLERLRVKPCRPASIDRELSAVLEPNGQVRLERTEGTDFAGNQTTFELDANGTATFDGLKLEWQFGLGRGKGLPRFGKNCEYFDAERVGSPVTLRHWQPGDRFQPIGMNSTLKLQDFFTNQRIPRKKRHRLALAATASGEIFWVEGQRISERFKLTNHTIRRLHWAWHRL
jgi:tRNA(Ile)-lysidine synthase